MTKGRHPNTSEFTFLNSPGVSPLSDSTRFQANPFTFDMALSDHVTMETVGGQTLVARRPTSQRLPPLRIQRSRHNEFDGGFLEEEEEWEEDVEEEGKQLLYNFVHDQATTEDPEAAEFLDIQNLTPAGYANPGWAKAGRELRQMADVFAQTAERRRVKQKASEVNVHMTYGEFKDLLSELFAAGRITKERIVVLFFFCSDMAIRAVKGGAELCSKFLKWSFSFLADNVCDWVRSHGGWGEVLSTPFSSFPRMLFFASVIILTGYGVIKYINR